MLRLMAVTDGLDGGLDALVARVQAAVRGGATCVQLRLKRAPARVLADAARALIAAVPVPVLINDRFDVALATGAAGVHVGADDIATRDIRRLTPPGFIIGTSVGCTAEADNAAWADFVGIGPIYATASKADAGDAIGLAEFTRLLLLTGKPAVAIGGMTPDRASEIIHAHGSGVAVIHALFGAPDIEAAARAFVTAMDSSAPAPRISAPRISAQ
jgi:thiamine-phosphate pyrophosphorylase